MRPQTYQYRCYSWGNCIFHNPRQNQPISTWLSLHYKSWIGLCRWLRQTEVLQRTEKL